jgi:hypothetical protein
MSDTLASIYARSVADPATNAFLNRERAAALRAELSKQVGLGEMQSRFLLAQEQLLAGDTRGAIAGLDSLRTLASLKVDANAPRNKSFFDLLAIAYLRLGEQENCALNMSASICILPLDGAARHVREEGARKAIALYEQLLRAFPDDRGSRWLLNVSYMAVGGYPARVPRQWLIPNIGAARDKTFPKFYNVAMNVGLAVNNLAGGLSVEDFNRDGLLDVFMTSWGLRDPVHLFLADGRGGYVDRTNEAGLAGITGGLNTIHADYDNDGFEDILILRGAWLGESGKHPCSLLHNRGDGTFEDVTFAAGLGSLHPRHSAAWADFNLDGLLDLFIGKESTSNGTTSHPSELFLNKGNGKFVEVSRLVGIDLDAFVKGVVWSDVNNDGLPDLFVSVLSGPNRLFMNRGGASITLWRFEESAIAAGVQLPIMSFPTWFWDYDNDGWNDLLVLSYDIRNSGALHDAVAVEYLGETPAIEHTRLYRNKGDGTFEDVSVKAGLAGKVIYAMGSNFGDLDNDGWLDFYVGTGNPDLRSIIPNRMFRGVAGKRFDEVTMEGGFGHLQKGHATAFADFDRDGDQDIYMVVGGAYQGDMFTNVLFENPGWAGRSWITLELEGRTANRSAIGARVELLLADSAGTERTVHRTVGTGGSFGATSLQVHVGLGNAVRVKHVRVTWPDAARSANTWPNLAPNRAYRIVQGQAPVVLSRPPVPFAQLAASHP